MQRLGFPPNASLEHKKLSVDLAEVIIKWELQRIKEDENETKTDEDASGSMPVRRAVDFNEYPTYRKKAPTSDFGRSSKFFNIRISFIVILLLLFFRFI